MAERPARLRIVSRMTDPQGGAQETKHARRGTVAREGGAVTIRYEDVLEGERAVFTLRAGGGAASMTRRGMTGAELTFAPGERRASRYVTPYGDIPVAVDTRRVALTDEEHAGALALDYDVYIAGERTASAALCIEWRL